MAKATKTEQKYKVVLELSQDEAEAVRSVFQSVGGVPIKTRRGFIDAVDDALQTAGVLVIAKDIVGNVNFV